VHLVQVVLKLDYSIFHLIRISLKIKVDVYTFQTIQHSLATTATSQTILQKYLQQFMVPIMI